MVWASVVRSPYAHARIKSVDVSTAREAEGVVAAFSGADLAEDWAATLPCVWPVTERHEAAQHRPLATDKARYQGDGVAVVVAETRAQAKDAAELVEVDYEPLPAVTDAEEALADGAPLVHDDLGTNRCYTWTLRDRRRRRRLREARGHRQGALPPAAADPERDRAARRHRAYEPATGEYTLWSATQIPHILRFWLAIVLGDPGGEAPGDRPRRRRRLRLEAERLRRGGARARPRQAARAPGQVDRGALGGYLATIHGRDRPAGDRARGDEDGKIRGVRAKLVVGAGRLPAARHAGTPLLGGWVYGGCYDIEAYDLEVRRRLHEHDPDRRLPRRRPPRGDVRDRAGDGRARAKLDMDPVELRRKNFITEFPHTIASGLEIDSGDFDGALDRALEMVDYDGLRKEQAERRARGDAKQLGIGFSTYVEMCGLAPSRILGAILYGAGGWDAATVRCLPTGTVEVFIGTSPHGQGHVTTFSQIVADRLGVPIDQVEVLHGDTTVMQLGLDTYGSRSLAVGGIALYNAAEKVIAKARDVVAHQLEVASRTTSSTTAAASRSRAPTSR